jgi:U3 small nucleolar RNA-associated protein 20
MRLVEPFQQLTKVERASDESTRLTHYCNALLDSTLVLGIDQEQTKALWGDLKELLKQAVDVKSTEILHPVDIFALGAGFHFFVEHSTDRNSTAELWPALCLASIACFGQTSEGRSRLGRCTY